MASRLAVVLLLLICFTSSAYWAVGEWLLDSGKPDNIRRAAQWMPWNADAWRLMTQVEPEHAAEHWRHVLRLAPRDIEARIALAQEAELVGRPTFAEALLLEASHIHKGYLPAWSLANFYLRQHDEPQFWRWAGRAATFEVDLTALFDLALGLRPEPAAIAQEFALRRPLALGQLLTASARAYLLEVALPVARQVAQARTAAAREQLLWDADDLLKRGNTRVALAYWNLAANAGLLPYAPADVAGGQPALVNGEFEHASLERGFDWRQGSAEIAVTIKGGLRVNLYGDQADTAVLAVQTTLLEPGCGYELRYRYRVGMPKGASPVRWLVGEARSEPLSAADWRETVWRFTAQSETAELKLVSQREPGTHKAAGSVEVAWARLARAAPDLSVGHR